MKGDTAAAERPRLVWQVAGGAPIEFEVWPERPLTIGRDGANSVVVDSGFVSKTHAVIRFANGEYTVEDLKSANGTRVNGLPVVVSTLASGDTIEFGDQQFLFTHDREAAPAGRGGLGKNTKLALAAIATLGVLGAFFAMVISAGTPPPGAPPPGAARAAAPAAPAAMPAVDVNAQAVRDVLERAQTAGIPATEALFDEANTALASGRLREATELYGAVVARDPKNQPAAQRFEETRTAWAQAIGDHAAEAERAASELRLNDAVLEWGQVLLLTDPSDARHRAAEDGIARARQRLAR